MPRIKVTKSNPPETKEILAKSIISIGKAADKLFLSGLNKHAVIVLLQAETKLSQRDIKTVLEALPKLEGWYCK